MSETIGGGGPVYAGPRPGDRIASIEDADLLSVGAIVVRADEPYQHRWQKGDQSGNFDPSCGWYNTYNGNACDNSDMARRIDRHSIVVESVPDDLGETVAQFTWRFRDTVMYGAERGLGAPDNALEVLDRMKVEFHPSVGQRIVNRHDRNMLPNGSRIYAGDPDVFDGFAVWTKTNGRWVQVFGTQNLSVDTPVAVIVDGLPDGDDPSPWLTAEREPSDRDLIAKFRAKAWQHGWDQKVKRRWCAEFERVMLRIGLSEHSVEELSLAGHRIGEVVTPEQAATLPVGVILSTVDGGFGVFQRVEKAKNRAGTRLLNGWNYTRHFAPQMMIRALDGNTTTGFFTCPSIAVMNEAPVGTVITAGGANNYFKKVLMPVSPEDRSWTTVMNFNRPDETTPDVPTYNARAFTPGPQGQFKFVRFGPREER